MTHILSLLVENKFGVLSRVAGLFSGRGFNIESISIAPTLDPSISQMTILTTGDDKVIEQITKQLNKTIDIIKVSDFSDQEYILREVALIKVSAKGHDREEALRITNIFRANIIDSSSTTYTIEVTGDDKKIQAMVNLLRPLGIKDMVRTGPIAILREDKDKNK
jgi:acetolactate synthase-1/3 small subunit